MPLTSLLLNVTWELLYGLFLPSDLLGRIVMLSWLAIDCVLVRCAFVYDRVAYGQPVRDHCASLLIAGIAVAFFANALFPFYFWDVTECAIAHGMLLQVEFCLRSGSFVRNTLNTDIASPQVLLSWSSVLHVLSNASTRGHSLIIWALRFAGSLLASSPAFLYHPDFPKYYQSALGKTLTISVLAGDLVYPAVYLWVRRCTNPVAVDPKIR